MSKFAPCCYTACFAGACSSENIRFTLACHPLRVFELDLRSGELHKQGMKIRLQGQPVEILAMLLQRPGEIVSREELQKKLWPADTFVDFEQGLNNAMKRLPGLWMTTLRVLISSKHCHVTASASSC